MSKDPPAGLPCACRSNSNLYSYASSNPLRNVDPSGDYVLVYRDGGGGGGGEVVTGGGGVGTPTSTQPPSVPKWQTLYCYIQDILVVATIVLAVLGYFVSPSQVLSWATLAVGSSLIADSYAILSSLEGGSFNLLGFLSAMEDFTWTLLNGLVIPLVNNIWEDLVIGAEAAALLTPLAIVKVLVIGTVATLGILGLAEQGCLPSK